MSQVACESRINLISLVQNAKFVSSCRNTSLQPSYRGNLLSGQNVITLVYHCLSPWNYDMCAKAVSILICTMPGAMVALQSLNWFWFFYKKVLTLL